VAPPFVYLHAVSGTIRPEVKVSAQNCYHEAKGAFTGEVRYSDEFNRALTF
jgi:triosephosphate isomerase